MEQKEFGRLCLREMATQEISQERVATYLGINQARLSQILHGKISMRYDEGESLKQLLGLEESPLKDPSMPALRVADHKLAVAWAVVRDLPDEGQTDVCRLVKWFVRGMQNELGPHGREAYTMLEALV